MDGEAERISEVESSRSLFLELKKYSASAPQKTSGIESVMREDQTQSVAFRNAELDSERLRVFGISGCLRSSCL